MCALSFMCGACCDYISAVCCILDVHFFVLFWFFFLFKQKTAYEMRISDWSSDVCSSDLFNREWLVGWLQNPTTIRPGGVMWFKHAKAGDPHDTIDTAAVEKHPKVDAATAEKLADALLLLKSGLVPEGAYKPEAANMTMGKLAFGKLRGCVACHQDAQGQGGLSGPQLYDAGQRLRPDYVLTYTKDPQKFDPHVWMPTLTLSEPDLQRLTGYIVSLGKEAK